MKDVGEQEEVVPLCCEPRMRRSKVKGMMTRKGLVGCPDNREMRKGRNDLQMTRT